MVVWLCGVCGMLCVWCVVCVVYVWLVAGGWWLGYIPGANDRDNTTNGTGFGTHGQTTKNHDQTTKIFRDYSDVWFFLL